MKFGDYLADSRKLVSNVKLDNFERIIICGVGGSAIAGDYLCDFLWGERTVIISREYDIPFLAKKDLCIVISYSGNTEETLSQYKQALKTGCKIICLASGGKLAEMALRDGCTLINLPSGIKPRASFPLMLGCLLNLLELKVPVLEPVDLKFARKLASKIEGNAIFIYSSQHLKSAGYRFRTQLNENSKISANHSFFPELCHNEINIFEYEHYRNAVVIILRSSFESSKMADRINGFISLIKDKISVLEVRIKSKSIIEESLSMTWLLDLISIFLAESLLRKADETILIDELKRLLSK